MKIHRGKKKGFKIWYITLIIAIVSFVFACVFFNEAIASMHMTTLIDFFALLALTSIYSYYISMSIILGIAFTIATIILAILRR